MDNIKNDNYYIQKIQQDLKFIVRHMKNRIVYDTKCCVITNVRLYLKNCGGCQCGTPGELIYRN
jgi:hypothetical protein